MAEASPRNVALLSIRPEYVRRILNGEKTVEFRAGSFPEGVRVVVVYCTAPISSVVAYFEVGEVVTGSPQQLWRRYRHGAGIDRDSFFAYFGSRANGRALEIASVFKLSESRTLSDIEAGITPPQSFRYLEPRHLERIKRWAA